MSSQLYALILAGGSGERFWPLSRKTRPKQLLSLFSEETMLQGTLKRLEGFIPKENILILTNCDQEPGVRALLKDFPQENIVAEPAKRDTAAAIALGVGWISKRNPDATMIVLPADHLIQNVGNFQKTLQTAAQAARETGELVTIGIQPTWACPGFGYIELAEKITLTNPTDGPDIFTVHRFREKPSAELAEEFLKQGHFRWNAGMFIWTIRAVQNVLKNHAPELAAFVQEIQSTENLLALLAEKFPHLPKISIDYAIMEKAEKVLVVESAFDWDDVGSWTAVGKYLPGDEHNNLSNTPFSIMDASGNLVFSQGKKHIALMGVHDLIVVETDDAIMICNIHEAEKIKQLVSQIPEPLQ